MAAITYQSLALKKKDLTKTNFSLLKSAKIPNIHFLTDLCLGFWMCVCVCVGGGGGGGVFLTPMIFKMVTVKSWPLKNASNSAVLPC